MEISRVSPSSVNVSVETSNTKLEQFQTPARQVAEAPITKEVSKRNEPRLEELQNAMRDLPDVEANKVIAIRQAIARGEIGIDSVTLAKLMATYHRGSDN